MFKRVVERPIAVLMISLAATLFGGLAYQQLRVALMPPLSYPTLTVLTAYPGAAPEEVELEITNILENRLSTLEGLLSVESRSLSGQSEITLSLRWEAQLDRALQRVYERLDRVELPRGVSPPQVLRYDPSLDPLMVISLSSKVNKGEDVVRNLSEIRRYAMDVLSPALYQIEGVAAVKVTGGDEPLLDVRVHLDALHRLGLTIDDVSRSLNANHVNQAGGLLRTERGDILIRTLSEIDSLKALKSLVIKQVSSLSPSMNSSTEDELTPRGEESWVRLSDIADVERRVQERTSWVQINRSAAVRVQIYRQSESDLVSVSKRVRQQLFSSGELERGDELKIAHPEGLQAQIMSDQATFIERALSEVNAAISFGGLLAILVLYAFLSSWSQTLIIAVAMPLSVILAFIPLRVFGVSLNLMSLGGLALGVGMLVDNAVVVLESISRHLELGVDRKVAAQRGVSEVGSAVFASTVTTVAVFAPVAFIEGLAGQIFRDLALTVVSALIASLCVALFIVPTLSARLGSNRGRRTGRQDEEQITELSIDSVSTNGHRLHIDDIEIEGVEEPPLLVVNQWPRWLKIWSTPGWPHKLKAVVSLPLLGLEGGLSLIAVLFLLAGKSLLALVYVVTWVPIRLISIPLKWVSQATNWLYDLIKLSYVKTLRASMRSPAAVISLALILLWWSYEKQREIPRSLLPDISQGVVIADLEYPVGTSLQGTRERVRWWLERLLEDESVSLIDITIGQDQAEEQPGERRGPHQARLSISLNSPSEEDRFKSSLQSLLQVAPGAALQLSRPSLIQSSPPMRVVLKGQSLESLKEAEDRVLQSLKSFSQLSDIERTFGQGAPELKLIYDYQKLKHLGLSPEEVAHQVKSQLSGADALELIWDGEKLPVKVRAIYADELERADLLTLPIKTMQNTSSMSAIPLGSIADLKPDEGPAEIRHVNGQRAAEITANLSAFDLDEVALLAQGMLREMALPPGVDGEVAGQEREVRESARALAEILLISLFLVFVVMATQFESLRAPLLIMGSVPLALIGVIFGLWISHTPLSIVVFVGMITLGGVVVNNAIVFMDAVQHIHRTNPHLPKTQVLILAGERRLRPILMTTLTTLLGLTPMLVSGGEGAELRSPLALTMMFGLSFSTLLVLYILPALYLLFMPTHPTLNETGDVR